MRTRACLGLLGPVLLAGIFLSSAMAEKKMPAMRKVGDKILREGMELDHEQEEALPDTSGEKALASARGCKYVRCGTRKFSVCSVWCIGLVCMQGFSNRCPCVLGRSENDEGNEVRRLPG